MAKRCSSSRKSYGPTSFRRRTHSRHAQHGALLRRNAPYLLGLAGRHGLVGRLRLLQDAAAQGPRDSGSHCRRRDALAWRTGRKGGATGHQESGGEDRPERQGDGDQVDLAHQRFGGLPGTRPVHQGYRGTTGRYQTQAGRHHGSPQRRRPHPIREGLRRYGGPDAHRRQSQSQRRRTGSARRLDAGRHRTGTRRRPAGFAGVGGRQLPADHPTGNDPPYH